MKSIIFTWSVAFALLLSGCAKEPSANGRTGEQVSVQIHTKALQGGIIEGVKVDKIRLLLFDRNEGLVLNSTTSGGTLVENPDEQFTIDVETGTYRFAVIVNETPAMTAKLNAVKSYAGATQIREEWQSGVLTDETIPLVNYGTLEITAGSTPGQGVGRVTEFDATGPNTSLPTNPITVTMPRALAKVSLFMRKGDAATDEVVINRVQVVNIPSHWSLFQQETAETVNAPVFTGPKTIDPTSGEVEYASRKYHNMIPSGTIIPEKYFADYSGSGIDPATDEANAAYLFVNATFGGVPTTYKVLLRESDANFRLLRNTNYNVYVTISSIGAKGIYAVIEPVKMYNITVNWKPVEGLVIVSDLEKDFNQNINVWNDYSVYSGVLKVYQGDAYHDALFKYGSLFAINNDTGATTEQDFVAPVSAEDTKDVIWHPGTYNVTNITGWNGIPYISDGSNFTSGNSSPQVIAGKGDPCRLAALTPHQIGVEGIIDNQQWHMATPAEYALLMKAAGGAGSENNDGYRSFRELLIPNVKYRDASGKLTAAHNNEGRYWSTEANQAFSFSSLLASGAFQAAQPEQAYTVRCIRNTIPRADISISPTLLFYYTGSEINGGQFAVTSNVPYWKVELIKSGEGVGTSTDFNDFSFSPFASGVTHMTEGGYTSTPRIYVKRRVNRIEDRTFGMKFSSIHYTGEELTYYYTVTQKKYDIRGQLTIDGADANKWLPAAAQKYTIHIALTPDDVPMPVGAKLKVEYSYHGTLRGTSTVVTTTDEYKYLYDSEIDIQANGTPDAIGLSFKIFMDEGTGYREIGMQDYYQNK